MTKDSPFILGMHEKEYPRMLELRAEDLERVAGGWHDPTKCGCPTATITPNADGGDDGMD